MWRHFSGVKSRRTNVTEGESRKWDTVSLWKNFDNYSVINTNFSRWHVSFPLQLTFSCSNTWCEPFLFFWNSIFPSRLYFLLSSRPGASINAFDAGSNQCSRDIHPFYCRLHLTLLLEKTTKKWIPIVSNFIFFYIFLFFSFNFPSRENNKKI